MSATAQAAPGAPASGFAAELWRAGASTYEAIVAHPFLAGLADGTLPRAAFAYFVAQDSHYLQVYARALALTAARATDPAAVQMFAAHAANAVAVEQDLHARLLAGLGLSSEDVASTPVGPTTLAYTSYLLAVCATGSYAEAVAAVLPCYWVYREVGQTLLERSSPDPAYATWIATYGSAEFDAVVAAVVATADALGPSTSPAERARCREHFATTTRYEWMFWDAAWTGLGWPV